MSLATFLIPLVPSLPSPPVPLNDNTREGVLPVVASTNLATTPNGSHQRSKITVDASPKSTPPAHVLTAFLFAAAGTEPPNNANRSIGQIYCIGPAGDGPQRLQVSSPATASLSPSRHTLNSLIISNEYIFSRFNDIDLLRSVRAACGMPRRRG